MHTRSLNIEQLGRGLISDTKRGGEGTYRIPGLDRQTMEDSINSFRTGGQWYVPTLLFDARPSHHDYLGGKDINIRA